MRDLARREAIGAHSSAHSWLRLSQNVAGIQISLLTIPRERPSGRQTHGEEEAFFAQLADWLKEETGYIQIMVQSRRRWRMRFPIHQSVSQHGY